MDELAIVSYGRQFLNNYPVQEYKDALIRAFRNNRADYIVLEDNPSGQKFLAAGVAWAIDEGLLYNYNDRNRNNTQQVVSSFRLTEKGRKEILGQS